MRFLWHDMLWLLLALPAAMLGYLALLRRRKPAFSYSNLELLRHAASGQVLRRHVPPLLLLIALILLVLASARPSALIAFPSEQRMVVLAIDVSYSMSADDVAPTRLSAAQSAAREFVRSQPADVRIAVVAFAGDADLVQPATRDRAEVLSAIDHLQLQYNTAIGSGVLASLLTVFPTAELGGDYDIFGMGRSPVPPQPVLRNQPLRELQHVRAAAAVPGSYTSAAVVLLSDGRDNGGFPALLAAKLAADHGLRVYTIGFGRASDARIALDGELLDASFDEQTLTQIARITQARYAHASTAEELRDVYRSLTGQVVLERRERELSAALVAVAAILCVFGAGLSLAWAPAVAT